VVSVHYASAAGSTWSRTPLKGSNPPGGSYFLQQAAGAGGTVALPMPDATGRSAMSASSGKVALTSSASCPGDAMCGGSSNHALVDFVGYSGANAYEGRAAAPGSSNTTSAARSAGDSDDNAADLLARAFAPKGGR
jgi:hypothetical protein